MQKTSAKATFWSQKAPSRPEIHSRFTNPHQSYPGKLDLKCPTANTSYLPHTFGDLQDAAPTNLIDIIQTGSKAVKQAKRMEHQKNVSFFSQKMYTRNVSKNCPKWRQTVFFPTNESPAVILSKIDYHSGDFIVCDFGPRVLWALSTLFWYFCLNNIV